MTNSYFSFYNQLRKRDYTIHQLIERYINFMYSMNDDFTCGFYGILEGGNFIPSCVKAMNTDLDAHKGSICEEIQQLHIPLITNDVHQDIYDLSDVVFGTENLNEQFPYIGFTNFQKLDNLLANAFSNQPHNYVLFNLVYNDFVIATLCLFSQKSVEDLQLDLEFFQFIRNNLETLINERLLQEDILTNRRITETASSIVNSKRYYSYDKSLVLGRLLDLAFELLDEPDYGSALLFENGSWTYVHAIGHDIDLLKKIQLPEEMHRFSSDFWSNYQEVAQNIYFIENILETKETGTTLNHSDSLNKIKQVSMPIKQTIQLHLSLNDALIGIISLDKKDSSTTSFTRKTIKVLTQLHYLGQFLLTYSSLAITTQSFEEITDLVARMIVPDTITKDTFLSLFLKLLVRRLYEVDYASAYIVDSEGIHFLASVGHDLEGLQQIPFKPDHFINPHDYSLPKNLDIDYNSNYDNSNISISLLTDLMKNAENVMPDDIYKQFNLVSRSIKDGLIAEAALEEGVYMNISVDIASDSDANFSKDSIKLFTTLINLGFSFISNQYYITKYQTLNKDLSNTVQKRTQALEETNRKLRDIAKKDSLTGLLNHKYIIAKLTKMIAYKKPLSLFLFDIDYFKVVNDLYGHQVGDSVLLKISQLLNKEKKIIPGRYGGEEFLIILPNMDLPEAVSYCQGLLKTIESTDLVKGHTITVSGGVATYKKGTSTELIQVADAYLYNAKNSGRNRIEYGYC